MNKTCATCPFLEANRGKPTPTDFKCVEQNQTDWYSQENIDGIWQVMRSQPIQFLSCHSSDPDYYGKEDSNIIHVCAGGSLFVYMHIMIYEHEGGNYDNYVKVVGKEVAMSLMTMAEKCFALKTGRTSPLWGGMVLPSSVTLDIENVHWPTGFKNVVKQFKKILKKSK